MNDLPPYYWASAPNKVDYPRLLRDFSGPGLGRHK